MHDLVSKFGCAINAINATFIYSSANISCTYSIVNDKDDNTLCIIPSSWTFVKKNVSFYI